MFNVWTLTFHATNLFSMYLPGCVTILPHDLYLNFHILLGWGRVVYDNVKDLPQLCTIHQKLSKFAITFVSWGGGREG